MTEAIGDGWWSGGSARVLRWLAIPATVAVLTLIALALSSESRDQYNERNDSSPVESSAQPTAGTESSDSVTSSDEQPVDFQPSEEFKGWGRGGSTRSSTSEVVIAGDEGTYRVEVKPDGTVSARDEEPTQPEEPDQSSETDEAYGAIRLDVNGELELVPLGDEKALDVLVSPSPEDDGLVLELIVGFKPSDNTEPVIGARSEILYRDGALEVAYDDGTTYDGDPSEPLVAMEARWARTPAEDTESKTFNIRDGRIRLWYAQDGNLMAGRPRFDVSIEPGQDLAIVFDGSEPAVVTVDELQAGDIAITPADGGFDRSGPDGVTTEFRPENGPGPLTATEVDPEGNRVDLHPDEDAAVELSDSPTASPVGPHIVFASPPRPLPWRLVTITIATIAVASIALGLSLHLRRGEEIPTLRTDTTSDDREGGADPFERLLAELAADPDQTRAVRRAFAEAERGHGALPARTASETPFEWSTRIAANNPELGRPVTAMCDLFAKARFAPGQSTEADRHAMLQHLRASRELATGRQTVLAGAGRSK